MHHLNYKSIVRAFNLDDFLHRTFVRFDRLESFHIGPQIRILFLGQPNPARGSRQRETHDEIGSRQLGSAKIRAIVGRRGYLAFEKVEVGLEIGLEVFGSK